MNLQESIRNDLNKLSIKEDRGVEYSVYVYGEWASDTNGSLTKDEAMELANEYELEGYSSEDIEIRDEEGNTVNFEGNTMNSANLLVHLREIY